MTETTRQRTTWYTWSALVLGAALAVAVALPLRLVASEGPQALPIGWEAAVTLLFAIDLVARWMRGPNGSMGRRLGLSVDALAVLPLGLVYPPAGLLRLLKLVRVVSLHRALRRNVAVHPTALRLAIFGLGLSVFGHWLACGWMALGGGRATTLDSTYLDALYWCVTTLTAVGYGDITPTTRAQTVYAMGVMLLGIGVYGFVIGSVATLLSRMDLARAQHMATLERLTGFLRYRRIPAGLRRHIFDYYNYVWDRRMGYDEASVLADLPTTLRRELALVLRGELLEKLSFLDGASRELIHDLSEQLIPMVYSPGDVIVREGDQGHHIYFIGSGSVEVIGSDGVTPIRTLSDGDFFGELALLHDQPRTATVRALGYCDLYCLDRTTFLTTLEGYPEFAAHIQTTSQARMDLL